jgi:hypothetical protein
LVSSHAVPVSTSREKIVKAGVPSSAFPSTVQSSKRGGGKHDLSIEEKLTSSSSYLTSTQVRSGVRVLIYIDPDYFKDKDFDQVLSEIAEQIREAGAKVIEARANPIVAVIPNIDVLSAVENIPGVAYIRDGEVQTSFPLAGNTMSEGVYNVSANYAWAKGYNGTGIRVGVLDIYSGGFSNYQDLVSQGELPANTYLYTQYGTGTGVHGSACAEILYDVAPGIDGLYIGIANDTWEMYNVTKWFIEDGVKVVSHSIAHFGWLPSQFDTNGDGTPEFCDVYKVINYTVNSGATWVNAAGNSRLEHWEDDWTDLD